MAWDQIFGGVFDEQLTQSETVELLTKLDFLDFPQEKEACCGFEDLNINFKSIKARDRKQMSILAS